jgi:hypothetical protein
MTGFVGQFMTFPLAQKRGVLKEEGIEAEIIRISAAAGRAALSGGEVDYSTGIGGTAIGGALSGVPIKVVACYVPARCSLWWRGLKSNRSKRSKAKRWRCSSSAASRTSRHGP